MSKVTRNEDVKCKEALDARTLRVDVVPDTHTGQWKKEFILDMFFVNAIRAMFINYTLCLMISKYYLLLALGFVIETKLL